MDSPSKDFIKLAEELDEKLNKAQDLKHRVESMSDDNVLDEAWQLWGETAQLLQLIEESAEAIVAVCHYIRGRKSVEDILEELVDGELMSQQARRQLSKKAKDKKIYGKIRAYKIKRLKVRVVEGKKKRGID